MDDIGQMDDIGRSAFTLNVGWWLVCLAAVVVLLRVCRNPKPTPAALAAYAIAQ